MYLRSNFSWSDFVVESDPEYMVISRKRILDQNLAEPGSALIAGGDRAIISAERMLERVSVSRCMSLASSMAQRRDASAISIMSVPCALDGMTPSAAVQEILRCCKSVRQDIAVTKDRTFVAA